MAKVPDVDQTWLDSVARRATARGGSNVNPDYAAKRAAFKRWKGKVVEVIGDEAWYERSEKRRTRRQKEEEANGGQPLSNNPVRRKKEARWQRKHGPMWKVRMDEHEAGMLRGRQRKEERESD